MKQNKEYFMTPEQWMRIGLRVRRMRLQRRITVVQMAELLNISCGHVQEIENGSEKPSLEVLVRYAEAFNTSLDYLILGISPIPGVGDGTVRLRCDKMAQPLSEDEDSETVDADKESNSSKIAEDDESAAAQEAYTDAEKIPKIEKQPEINWMRIGNRIREMRLQRGISGAELADAVHISRAHLSNIERGKKAAGVDVIVCIAQALGVSIDFIVRGIRPVIGASDWGLRLHCDEQPAAELWESENEDEAVLPE